VLTLSKGPGYPLFIAAAYKAHLPLKLAEHLVHLLAAGTAGLALAKVSRTRALGVVAYGAIALDPGYLGQWASSITRDALYGSFCLLLVAATLLFVAYVPALVRRGVLAVPVVLAAGIALGLVAGAYFLTRDERSWLAPAILAAGLAGLTTWRREGRVGLWHGCAVAVALLLAAASFSWSTNWVSSRNQAAYGTSVISELAEGEIARAYVEWQRVDRGEPEPLVPVNAEQREAVYDVSAAAAELEPQLKGAAAHWMVGDCAPPALEGCEYTGGYFVWAMREAATATGHMSTGGEAQRFFGQLSDEIAAACRTTLPCTDPGLASMPPLDHIFPGRIPGSVWAAADHMMSFDVAEPTRVREVMGSPEQWELMISPLRGIDGARGDYTALERRAADRQQVVAGLTDLYRWAARLGALPALVGLGLVVTRTGRRHATTVAVGAVMLIAALSRITLLGMIDATAFKAARYGSYILPGVDFFVVFLLIGWWVLATVTRDAVRRRRARPTSDHGTGGNAGDAGHGPEPSRKPPSTAVGPAPVPVPTIR
jgi:hypothetical protein